MLSWFRERRSTRLAWRGRLGLLALGSALGLLAAETVARGVAHARELRVQQHWQRVERGQERVPDPAQLGHMVRCSRDPEIVYEFLPGISANFKGQPCRINAQGVRGADWPPLQRDERTLRILGIGDSVMFGWGVPEQDCFLRVLEGALRARLPGRDVQVLNTGVPGYNTAMEVAAFERRWLAWQPDIVVLDWVGNDADLPNMIAGLSPWTDLRHVYLADLLRTAIGRQVRRGMPLEGAPMAGDRFESDPDRVPAQYRHMVGEAGVSAALQRLAALSRQHGFRVLVATHFRAPAYVQETCTAAGLPLVANEAAVGEHLRAQGRTIDDYGNSDLVLSADDIHPSSIGHRVYAATIERSLLDSGWLAERPAAERGGPERNRPPVSPR